MQSIPIKTTYTGLGYADFTYNLENPIQINPKQLQIKLMGGGVTRSIPNIYNFDGFNNTVIRVSNNNWVSSTDITLYRGNYSVEEIAAAINAEIGNWYTDPNDPAFLMGVNIVTDQVYISIDDTKMKNGSFGINLGVSQICETLGFSAVKFFEGTGLYTCDVTPQSDRFGSFLDIYVSGFGDISILNGKTCEYLTSINLNSNSGQSLFEIDPRGFETPIMVRNAVSTLRSIKISFNGD